MVTDKGSSIGLKRDILSFALSLSLSLSFSILTRVSPCLSLSLSTVCKNRAPRVADPPPAFSSSLLGGGLSELDHLLQELNATQFNITGTGGVVFVCVCVFVCMFLCLCFFNHH